MENKIAVNIIIEREIVDAEEVFIASSPDVNVFAEGKTIDESKKKFLVGLKIHLDAFPDERQNLLIEDKDKYEMPLVSRVFL
ncbi:MAG: hypothetical protein AABX48_01120 [Nanoarchaeota archaeon]